MAAYGAGHNMQKVVRRVPRMPVERFSSTCRCLRCASVLCGIRLLLRFLHMHMHESI